ncbi:MAG: hypothetical protein IJZ51_04450 [Ruminiclostridium sp.]|nr:hypothetical protein [Ruminiclostridium sp.]
MSGSGEILLLPLGVALIVPVAVIGLAAVAAGTAAKGFGAAVSYTAKAIEQARINRAASKLASISGEIDSISNRMHQELAEAAAQSYDEYEKELKLIEETFSESADLSAYNARCVAAKERLDAKINESTTAIEKRYEKELAIAGGKIRERLIEAREIEIERMEAFSGAIEERQQNFRLMADSSMKEARQVIDDLKNCYGESKIVQDLVRILEQAYSTAQNRYANGEYEATLIDSYSIMEQATVGVGDILRDERRAATLYSRSAVAVEELKNYLQNFRSVSYTLEETYSGEPLTVQVEDFTPFFAGDWQKAEEIYKDLYSRISAGSYDSFTSEELADILAEAERVNRSFLNSVEKAYERLHNNLIRNEYADIIAASYVEMGFEEIDPGEYNPLEQTVMLFHNPDTDDMIRVTLRPEYNEEGKLETAIEVECHDEELDSDNLELKRNTQRETVCNNIMESAIGKKLGVTAQQSCRRGTQNRNAF